jgi:SAM-dependent methyltransferase
MYISLMDTRTLKFYNENSANLAATYDSCSGGISDHRAEGRASFAEAFPSGAKILDVGCGSGRDLRILWKLGYAADGVDSCEEFVDMINDDTSRATARPTHGLTDSPSPGLSALEHSRTPALLDSLPELARIADAAYDGVLCSAVLMHLPEEELFDAVFALRRVLRKRGRLLLSIPMSDDTIDPETKRDPNGRLFNGVVPEQLQLLLERVGFNLLNRWESADSLNRDHRKWATMLFELE